MLYNFIDGFNIIQVRDDFLVETALTAHES